MIADNRLAEKAGWDPTLLALELQELSLELNLDVTVTGFEMAEIDLVVGEVGGDDAGRGGRHSGDRSFFTSCIAAR